MHTQEQAQVSPISVSLKETVIEKTMSARTYAEILDIGVEGMRGRGVLRDKGETIYENRRNCTGGFEDV